MLAEIIKSIDEIGQSFRKDELAYLALTSKAEHLMRDKIAFSLYQRLDDSRIVSREYKRVDLVILKKKDNEFKPVNSIQFKAYYTFDFQTEERANYFKKFIQEDFEKSRKVCPDSRYFSILFCVHSKSKIEGYSQKIIKYRNGINKALTNKTEKEILDKARITVGKLGFMVLKEGLIQGGSAFGTKTDILYWIFG